MATRPTRTGSTAPSKLVLIDWMVPHEELSDPATALRARVLGVSLLLLSVTSMGFAFSIAGLEGYSLRTPAVLILGCSSLLGFIIMTLYKSLNGISLIAYTPCIFTILGVVAMMGGTIGMEHQSLWFLLIIPILSSVLLGPRISSVFTLTTFAVILYFYIFREDYLHLSGNTYKDPDLHFRFRALCAGFGCLMIYVLAALFESERRRALRQVQAGTEQVLELNRDLSGALQKVEASKRAAEEDSERKSEFIRVMRSSSASQSEAINSTRSSMAEMNGLIKTISLSAGTMAHSAEDSGVAADEIAATSKAVLEQIDTMVGTVKDTASAIEEMTVSVRQVANNVDELSSTAEHTSVAMNQMETSIANVERNANDTAMLADDVIRNAEQGATSLQRTLAGVQAIQESSKEAATVMDNLAGEIASVGQILTVIEEVADQTKLLALNASIIAAQAGEEGRGFAVVADQIKGLAARTQNSTQEIASLISSVQTGAKEAVTAIKRGEEAVQTGFQLSKATEKVLDEIVAAASDSTKMVKSIAAATVEQSTGAKSVASSMERVATTVFQVAGATNEQARSSDKIMRATGRLREVANHVERSTQEQALSIKQILDALAKISDMVHQVHQAQNEQTQRSSDVLQSIDQALAAQKKQVKSLERFGESSQGDA